jgi:hypothetical protein
MSMEAAQHIALLNVSGSRQAADFSKPGLKIAC